MIVSYAYNFNTVYFKNKEHKPSYYNFKFYPGKVIECTIFSALLVHKASADSVSVA